MAYFVYKYHYQYTKKENIRQIILHIFSFQMFCKLRIFEQVNLFTTNNSTLKTVHVFLKKIIPYTFQT